MSLQKWLLSPRDKEQTRIQDGDCGWATETSWNCAGRAEMCGRKHKKTHWKGSLGLQVSFEVIDLGLHCFFVWFWVERILASFEHVVSPSATEVIVCVHSYLFTNRRNKVFVPQLHVLCFFVCFLSVFQVFNKKWESKPILYSIHMHGVSILSRTSLIFSMYTTMKTTRWFKLNCLTPILGVFLAEIWFVLNLNNFIYSTMRLSPSLQMCQHLI